ncbi:MAG TPA: response regulator [bacterium]|nr:response regulator [bacterium]HOR57092.1 response regulator [bacterium]HPL56125.1 response regulator [bacterium]
MSNEQANLRVLIVDDDQTLCDMYAERLQVEGFEVIVAHNGEEGAAKAVEYLPDVILLDLMMPKVNGFNTLEILKSTQETKDIPVLLLTALIQEENKQRGLQAGAEDYIIKSESMPGTVIDKIKEVVARAQQRKSGQLGVAPAQGVPTPPSVSPPSPQYPTTPPPPTTTSVPPAYGQPQQFSQPPVPPANTPPNTPTPPDQIYPQP